MNVDNRLKKLEAKLTIEDYCKCFTDQINIFTDKIYKSEACSIKDNPVVPTRQGVCSSCGKTVGILFDAQTVKTINELYEETAR